MVYNFQGNKQGGDKVPPDNPLNQVHFVLTSAAANSGIIHYTTGTSQKMKYLWFEMQIEELFDCIPKNLFTFFKALKDISRYFDYNGGTRILSIVQDPVNINSQND